MKDKDNLIGVLKTLFRWKKQLIILCGAVGIGSIIIVLLLPVYYKASTTFLAASPDQAKPELLFGEGNLKTEYYGNANDIDRLLTIANSNELVEFTDVDAAEDLVVISHIVENKKHSLNLYILKKIMNVILTERDIIETVGKELTSFEYNKLANIALSEDNLFNSLTLDDAKEEISHALRHRFMSSKTMGFVNFISKLNIG